VLTMPVSIGLRCTISPGCAMQRTHQLAAPSNLETATDLLAVICKQRVIKLDLTADGRAGGVINLLDCRALADALFDEPWQLLAVRCTSCAGSARSASLNCICTSHIAHQALNMSSQPDSSYYMAVVASIFHCCCSTLLASAAMCWKASMASVQSRCWTWWRHHSTPSSR
jgi:hypothetical protein